MIAAMWFATKAFFRGSDSLRPGYDLPYLSDWPDGYSPYPRDVVREKKQSQAAIVVATHREKGRAFYLAQGTSRIGGHCNNDIVIGDDRVNCEIEIRESRVFIRSIDGVPLKVNHHSIKEAELHEQDYVSVGGLQFFVMTWRRKNHG